ncbi:MAG: restriction endonuclease subunit S, partial [Chloroflexi bacterium]|nr:restriction endonuclease subunit S [Chloroflexota bacterium]
FSKEKNQLYEIPVISNGVGESAIHGWTDLPRIVKPCVTIAARGTIGYGEYRDYPFYPIIRLICLLPKDEINVKFLFHAVKTLKFKVPTTGIPQLTSPMISKYKIPVPPLPVQEAIVDILDRFEAIVHDIQDGLPAEIALRQKQYEYYRDKLLTFEPLETEAEAA